MKNDPYEITLYVPDGWRVMVEGNDTSLSGWKTEGRLCRVMYQSPKTGEFSWSVQFGKDVRS
jgi:hypothetical protein